MDTFVYNMTAPDADPEKETVFLHDLSPQLERELMRRAKSNDRDAPAEAAEIIERHVGEADGRD
jgi:hypothetical protein